MQRLADAAGGGRAYVAVPSENQSRVLRPAPRRDDGVTEEQMKPPVNMYVRSCDCQGACNETSCFCRQWGKECDAYCGCRKTIIKAAAQSLQALCQNPFDRYNPHLFGKDSASTSATNCFTAYVESITSQGATHLLSIDSIEHTLITEATDGLPSDYSEDFESWVEKFATLHEGTPERMAHMQLLCRMGLSRSGSYHWYSFCNEAWVEDDIYEHCRYCKTCVHWKGHWRCGKCKRCVTHLYIPCQGCGGKSNVFAADSQPKLGGSQVYGDATNERISVAGRAQTVENGQEERLAEQGSSKRARRG